MKLCVGTERVVLIPNDVFKRKEQTFRNSVKNSLKWIKKGKKKKS